MYMQNAFKVNENILIFANLQMKKKNQKQKQNKQKTKQTKQNPEIFLSNKDKINKRYILKR